MIRLSAEAALDLARIGRSITRSAGKNVARRVRTRIKASMGHLGRFPLMGRQGRLAETREHVVPGLPYIIIYSPLPHEMLVVRVIHGAMNWPPPEHPA